MQTIKMVVFDIDGVLTDGTILVNEQGEEQKRFNLKDVDAVFDLHKSGYKLAAITGENTAIVDYFANRFPWNFFYRGNKQKAETLSEIEEKTGIPMEEICYIGDGKYDAEALSMVGLGVCPADADRRAAKAADLILKRTAGHGCIEELVGILQSLQTPDEGAAYLMNRAEEHIRLFKRMTADYRLGNQIMRVGDEILESFRRKGALYLCGNGGSAADCQHIATEFVSRFFRERQGMNAEALSVNTSTLTAVGNDYSFERVFARQMEAKGKAGDILIGISTSGSSKNVLEAFRYCASVGIKTVLLTGEKAVFEEEPADYIIRVPSYVTPRIQEAHIFIGHVLAEYVEEKMDS